MERSFLHTMGRYDVILDTIISQKQLVSGNRGDDSLWPPPVLIVLEMNEVKRINTLHEYVTKFLDQVESFLE